MNAAGGAPRRTPVSLTIGRDTLGTSVAGAATRLVPLASTVVIAACYGASTELDAYFLALVVPVFLSGIVGMAITSVFVPPLVEEHERDPVGYGRLLDSLFSYVLLAGSAMTFLYATAAPLATRALGSALDGDARRVAVRVSIVLSPIVVLTILRCFLTAVYHSHKRFIAPIVAVSLTPAIMAASVLIFHRTAGVFALAGGNAAGHACEVVVLLAGLARRGRLPRLTLRLDPRVRRIFSLAFPQVLSGSVLRLNPVVDRTMASLLAAGSVSTLAYADRMQSMPIQILSIGFFNVALAHWSSERLTGGLESVGRSLLEIQRALVAMVVPAACLLWLLREPVTGLLLQRGAMGPSDAERVASVFGVFLIQVVPMALNYAYVQVLLVMKETRYLMRVGFFNAVSNVTLNAVFVLGLGMGVEGIALSTVTTTVFIFAIHNATLKHRLGFAPFGSGWRESAVVAASALAAGAGAGVVWAAGEAPYGQPAMLLSATVYLALYALLMSALRNREYLALRRMVIGR